MQRKGLRTSNLEYNILLIQGLISPKYGFLCVLMALLSSQGIVVKCTAAIFFRTVDWFISDTLLVRSYPDPPRPSNTFSTHKWHLGTRVTRVLHADSNVESVSYRERAGKEMAKHQLSKRRLDSLY